MRLNDYTFSFFTKLLIIEDRKNTKLVVMSFGHHDFLGLTMLFFWLGLTMLDIVVQKLKILQKQAMKRSR